MTAPAPKGPAACHRCALWRPNPRDLPGWGRCLCAGTLAEPDAVEGRHRVANAVLSTEWDAHCDSFRAKEPTPRT